MALYNYMSQILVELIKLANLIITVTKSFASAARIRDVLELDTNTVYSDDKKIYNTHAVEFDRVSMHYNEGAKDALENISFTAEPGEIIGVIGGTGSGKTTLVGLIPRFYDASSGTIRVDGRNVIPIRLKNCAKRCTSYCSARSCFAARCAKTCFGAIKMPTTKRCRQP